ncbi:preprotein translocase subunit SecE [Candidatus Woesebacteria bacterium RIFCSPHIGHO2_01_FULL_44_10]|uniref:Protein translocase subunit SecE n=1 Tax=Candidatus Woesebacteria bacterium RIFCSPLOWO2_01_FULL_44_14 TaxID=1802525 RepID=A0A1F8C3U4_9BACT|nr:MAG: preprotein translocase subunit SecE [Candidatus Woesebacteria bacterium RIFCSPHIGHO2_01_FULL_44_10]OGM56154.1 MAG: preprotein translocase subunit SecE [Candidatus Woesebacteria bacterium RIFCSPHIGHO2_12_FULL_44_11]OGM70957.1 MAG: preprotein translocase subunit SecE [Candidatus Woesebacteria bacterium RIFCSPLOWO2_01_FULL_44_14]
MLQYVPVKKFVSYFSGVADELSKVVWPKLSDVVKLTLIVIIISAIMAAFIGSIDFGFTKLLETLIK